MKTTLLLFILLLGAAPALVQAQNFRAVPPAQQPNAAELAYVGGKHPNATVRQPGLEEQPDKEAIALVTGFLNDLPVTNWNRTGAPAAHQRLAKGFVAYGPGYDDKLETDNLLNQWERNGKQFTDQHVTIETASTTQVATGNNHGLWVYVKGVWSATDGRGSGKLIQIPFHQLARVSNDRIERTYTSYGTDQLFYDLGFTLYAGPSGVVQRR